MSLTSATKKETNTYELEIAVSGEDLKAATDKVYKRRAKDISVPGFRKGKAPRKIIEKMYGEGVFTEDAVNDLYPGAYSAAVEEAGIEPVDRADVEILTLDSEEGFTFKATVTVKPEVNVTNYKGIEAVKTIYRVTDEDVETEINRMRERNARIITVEDRAAQDGDNVVIDFEGFVDDVAFEGGKGDGYQLTLGSHSFIDTFEEQIVGHNPGDEFDVNVTFPEEYHAEELKGKPAVFKVKLVEIKGKELPELDDEFVKDVSEHDTVEQLREEIKKNLTEQKDRRTQEEYENKLVDQVIANLEGEIPEVMYENHIDEMVRDFEYRVQSQGMNIQLYLQYTGMDMDSFRKTFREQAERQVKIRLALEKIAELENITPTEEDIEKEYEKVAEMYQMEADKIKGIISEKDLIADFKSSKAIDIVRDSSKATEEEEKKDNGEEA
ncbi:trigger factor [Ruminococcaceae bacterium OttesenSCG-928-L11]|nr:trigger factor [Ruminococcaceae bacterium OttesenSCG-928-L11]